MRRGDQALHGKHRVISRRWFVLENIQRCARDPSRSERLSEGLLIDQLSARAVENSSARVHYRESLARQHAIRFERKGGVESDVVALSVERDEVHKIDDD